MSTMWLTVAVVAIFVAVMMTVREIPVRQESVYSTESIEESGYNINELTAPAMAGPLLTIFTTIACKTMLRPFIVRFLLNQNGVSEIRQLVASKFKTLPPTYYPIARLSKIDYEYHVQAAVNAKDVLTTGLPPTTGSTIGGDNTNEAGYRSVMDYHAIYQSGKATPTMVMTKLVAAIQERVEPKLHLFVSFLKDDVLAQARASDQRWASQTQRSVLDGVPVAVKDMVSVHNHVLCYGGQTCSPPATAAQEDIMVRRFRELGAIILGVTVSTEGGVTPLGYSLWSDGPFNPYDVDYYPGGSSSGSAVAVATGLAPIALGFDGGGSIRIPASMSGVYGLAATYGRVETAAALDFTVVKGGPLAATVADAALAHIVMSSTTPLEEPHHYSKLYDGGVQGVPPGHLDGYLQAQRESDLSLEESSNIKGMRLGIFWDHFSHSDPEVVEQCVETVKFLESQGAVLVNITIPYLREIHLSHGLKILSEFAIAWETQFDDMSSGNMPSLEANTDVTIAMGKQLTATEVLAGEKIRSFAINHLRKEIFQDLKVDAIVSPTLGSKVPKPARGYRSTGESNTPLVYKVMRFIPMANFLGLPSISVPVGYEKETGLPIGFQIMGDAWMEHKLLLLAASIESKFVKRRKPPKEHYYDTLAEWMA